MATRDVTGERYFSTFIAGFIAHCSAVYCHQGAAPLTSQSSSTWWRRRWKTTTQRRRSRRHSACLTLKVKVTLPPANSGTHSATVAHHLHTEFELNFCNIMENWYNDAIVHSSLSTHQQYLNVPDTLYCRFVLCNLGDTLTEDEIEELLKQADHDNDGKITYDGMLIIRNYIT